MPAAQRVPELKCLPRPFAARMHDDDYYDDDYSSDDRDRYIREPPPPLQYSSGSEGGDYDSSHKVFKVKNSEGKWTKTMMPVPPHDRPSVAPKQVRWCSQAGRRLRGADASSVASTVCPGSFYGEEG